MAGKCSKIPGCAGFVQFQDGSQLCLGCDTTQFNLEPVDGVCQCLSGKILYGHVCIDPISGCMAYGSSSDGSIVCKFCNLTAKLIVNASGSCTCRSNYQLIDGSCFDVCGDGYLQNTSSLACDDGNTVDGDGCSSTCQIEEGYKC